MPRFSLIVCLLTLLAGQVQAQSLIDTMSVKTLDENISMHQCGWKLMHAQTGGWGKFPLDYDYVVKKIEGKNSLIDSYRHAQNHANATAISIDWDGISKNGQTALIAKPCMTITFGVSVYMPAFGAGGANHSGVNLITWRMGPGHIQPMQRAQTDQRTKKGNHYDWNAGRGPRLQYQMGFVRPKGKPPLHLPRIVGLNPSNEKSVTDAIRLATLKTWYELRLDIRLGEHLKQAQATIRTRPKGTKTWRQQSWTFPIDLTANDARNPQNWNALILDMPAGLWVASKPHAIPAPEDKNRYDQFLIKITSPGSAHAPGNTPQKTSAKTAQSPAVQSKPAHLFVYQPPKISARIQGPKRLFRDDAHQWNVTIKNITNQNQQGEIKITPIQGVSSLGKVLKKWKLKPHVEKTFKIKVDPNRMGAATLFVTHYLSETKSLRVASFSLNIFNHNRPVAAQNILKNASFELSTWFNGTTMTHGSETILSYAKNAQKKKIWAALPTEGWWIQGSDDIVVDQAKVTSAQSHSGKHSLQLKLQSQTPLSVISALGRYVPQGPVTLTAWVKTIHAKGHLNLGLITTVAQAESHLATGKNSLALPADSDWVRLSLTGQASDFRQAIAQITVESGTVFIDDVQIETGTHATAFNLRPNEWLRLEMVGYESNDPSQKRRSQRYIISHPQYTGPFINGLLPKWIQGQSATQTLKIYNDSRRAFTGVAQISYGPWNDLHRYKIDRFDLSQIKQGQSKSVLLKTQELANDAYVATVRVESKSKIILDGAKDFHANQLIGGASSASMLASRQAIRFAVVAKPDPGKIFGVGNAMLFQGGTAYSWWTGFPLRNFAMAGDIGVISTRDQMANDDASFLLAAGRLTSQVMNYAVDQQCPANSSFANPAHPRDIDIFNPKGWAFFKQRAQAIGRVLAAEPLVASVQMHNESQYLHKGHLTPSTYADADFRHWCKEHYDNLSMLNQHWKTDYTQWDQVEQIVSARYLEEEKSRPLPKGAAAINWMSITGGLTPKVVERMNQNPGKAMDWLRWRTDSTLRMYRTFRSEARKYDKKTWYGTNLAWPSFWPQMFMRFIRDMDVTMLDMRYTSGFKNSLGTPYEMLDTLEMAESTEPSKPIWGSEIYVRPVMPAEFVAMQNWAMVAHGMQNNMVFAWKPYSDHGTPKGTRAWEKPNAPRMWFMIDNDGTHLPHYDTYVRSIREIDRYHKQYNGHLIKRVKTDIALYISADTNEYVTFSTGNKPWNAPATRTRNLLNYALRHHGISANYVDDRTLPDTLGKYQTVIVPSSYVLSQEAAQKLANFTKAGGTLVLAGVSGQVDPWLKPYANVGGPAWADLQWETQSDTPKPTPVFGSKTLFQAAGYKHIISNATKITDTENHTLGWQRPWGKGTLIAYDVFPVQYSGNPHLPTAITQWTRQLIKLAKLQYAGRFVTEQPDLGTGSLGAGAPVVEVVVRVKSENEKFIFCMNQGGEGSGEIQIPIASDNWQATDVISGQPIENALVSQGVWRLKVNFKPWESRIIRMFQQSGDLPNN